MDEIEKLACEVIDCVVACRSGGKCGMLHMNRYFTLAECIELATTPGTRVTTIVNCNGKRVPGRQSAACGGYVGVKRVLTVPWADRHFSRGVVALATRMAVAVGILDGAPEEGGPG